jgi:hypothetical protein
MQISRRIALLILIGPALMCCSCGKSDQRKPVFPVQGKVLLDGKPLPRAFLVFHPIGESGPGVRRPIASAGEDGCFAPTTYAAEDGAPAGEYAVTVEYRRPPDQDETAPSENLLPPRYSKPVSTPLKVRIVEGQNDLEPFQVKR